MRHTPTPWTTCGDLIVGAPEPVLNPKVTPYPKKIAKLQWNYEGDRGATECRTQWPEAAANAAFILRAVNAHDVLFTACRLLTEWAAGKADLPDGLDVAIGAAEDAIAKANGGEGCR